MAVSVEAATPVADISARLYRRNVFAESADKSGCSFGPARR
jgi:hypothetical protein